MAVTNVMHNMNPSWFWNHIKESLEVSCSKSTTEAHASSELLNDSQGKGETKEYVPQYKHLCEQAKG